MTPPKKLTPSKTAVRVGKIKPQPFRISPGLSREEAMVKAPRPKNDARGFSYDRITGRGHWI